VIAPGYPAGGVAAVVVGACGRNEGRAAVRLLRALPRHGRKFELRPARSILISSSSEDYRDGVRTNDDGLMAPSVKGLTDARVDAIAQYVSGL
jgi:cytochrome c553